jgi:hypothetical protein
MPLRRALTSSIENSDSTRSRTSSAADDDDDDEDEDDDIAGIGVI